MSYLTFDTIRSYSPLASAASVVYAFQRPTASLSALSGYDITITGTTGVLRASAYVGTPLTSATLVSTAQVSGGAAGAFHFTSVQVPAASVLSVQVAWLSGATNNFDILFDTNAAVTAGEFALQGITYNTGYGNAGGTVAPKTSATFVSPKAARVGISSTLAVSSVTLATTLSSDDAGATVVIPNNYIIQGDLVGFATAVGALSTLDSLSATPQTFALDVGEFFYDGALPLGEFLRLRNLGQF